MLFKGARNFPLSFLLSKCGKWTSAENKSERGLKKVKEERGENRLGVQIAAIATRSTFTRNRGGVK